MPAAEQLYETAVLARAFPPTNPRHRPPPRRFRGSTLCCEKPHLESESAQRDHPGKNAGFTRIIFLGSRLHLVARCDSNSRSTGWSHDAHKLGLDPREVGPHARPLPLSHSNIHKLLPAGHPLPVPSRIHQLLGCLIAAFVALAYPALGADSTPSNPTNRVDPQLSLLIEASGKVHTSRSGTTLWTPAAVGIILRPGDRVRTEATSRAAVQLSDQSILRINENTTLEIHPPVRSQTQKVKVPNGSIFFFHRGSPTDLEFDTPLTTGAIRGTEFVVSVDPATAATHVALLDGKIELTPAGATQTEWLQSGEQIQLIQGQAPRKSPIVESRRIIQWALYYPLVVVESDLGLTESAQTRLSGILGLYRSGQIREAQEQFSQQLLQDPSVSILGASLDLAVGQVDSAENRLKSAPTHSAGARALRTLISAVRDSQPALLPAGPGLSASEWLAQSYAHQALFQWREALQSARSAVQLAPQSGWTHARVAELELALGHTLSSETSLRLAESYSPQLATLPMLRGFSLLADARPAHAMKEFDRALSLDAAVGQAWLGRGLAHAALHQDPAALKDLSTAAALEPQRAIHRSYLAKSYSSAGHVTRAEHEFKLATELDPLDPTSWFYSALHHAQNQQINRAIRELEKALELNEGRAIFRSRLLLDQDRAVRAANLAVLYQEADLSEAAHQSAARAVASDYANASAHLFLSDSYRVATGENRYDLRYQTAEQNELLLANLLAPAGAANLSRVIPQQQHLQFFNPKPLQLSSMTEYRSDGDWYQAASAYGTVSGTSYALDGIYEHRNGTQPNGKLEREQYSLQLKQQVTRRDEVFLEVSVLDQRAGDIAPLYNPSQAKTDFRVREQQEPNVFVGYHRIWSPESHTLLLLSRMTDTLTLHDGQPSLLFLRQTAGNITSVSTPPFFTLDSKSDFELYTAELQHLHRIQNHTLIAGGRWQFGNVDGDATLTRTLTGVVTDQHPENDMNRGSLYFYDHWSPYDSLTLIGGVSYDHIRFPANADLPPLLQGEESQSRLSPKAGLSYTPWRNGQFRAAYAQSLGGLYFDNSVRLEPSQIAGFIQSYRSLIPESVAGLIPGTRFETAHIAFDQTLKTQTYLGLGAEWLHSEGDREVGALTNGGLIPVPDTPTRTHQNLEFRERSLSFYAVQLLGQDWSAGARYRLSYAELDGRFPEIPSTATGLSSLEQHEQALLHKIDLTLRWQHPSGFFSQWDTSWMHQDSDGYIPVRESEDFWQHHFHVGYRFPQRRAEIRIGVLNITDQDYRLSPLNYTAGLPRSRTAIVSVQWHF